MTYFSFVPIYLFVLLAHARTRKDGAVKRWKNCNTDNSSVGREREKRDVIYINERCTDIYCLLRRP